MARTKDPTPKTKINFWAPTALVEQLQADRHRAESDTAFYVRVFREHLERMKVDTSSADQLVDAEELKRRVLRLEGAVLKLEHLNATLELKVRDRLAHLEAAQFAGPAQLRMRKK